MTRLIRNLMAFSRHDREALQVDGVDMALTSEIVTEMTA